MNIILSGLIFIAPPRLKKLLLRWIKGAHIGQFVHLGWFTFIDASEIVLDDHVTIRSFTIIKLAGKLHLGAYSQISILNLIYGTSSLVMGEFCYIGPQVLINVDEPITIGRATGIGPRSMLFTHGSFQSYLEGYKRKTAPITLGNNVWCAAGVFLHPGVTIGDNSLVNSRAVVIKDVSADTVVAGNPAKELFSMSKIRQNMTDEDKDAAIVEILTEFVDVSLQRELKVDRIENDKYSICFEYKQQTYFIALVPAHDTVPTPDRKCKQIYLVNKANWSPPDNTFVFDLANMATPYDVDPIHTELRLFMQRYYGVRFYDARI
ncbi:MAG TPA: transferase [Anaerolineae bacterium]|nr:transferase [Anaerolineae bacterium]